MPDRFLVAVATIVLLVAMLVGVVLGVPLFLTEEGIDVNAGLIVTGAAALGTVGALVWAVINGLELRRQADADHRQAAIMRNEATIEKRLDQARRVSAWAVAFEQEPEGLFPDTYGRVPYARKVNLTNSSTEAVYELVVYLVWVQGAAPHTGEELQARSGGGKGGIFRRRAIVQILPPGNYWLKLAGPTNTPMQGRLGVEVAFTDGAGRHWVRRVPSGNLESLDSTPVRHYGIGFPLPTYTKLEPW